MTVIKKKSELRKKMLGLRAAMPADERAQADAKILAAVTSLPEYKSARTIFVYISVSSEPDTRALIEDAWSKNKRVCVPRCVSKGTMQAHAITSWQDLQAGAYNIPEPKKNCPLISPNEIDLLIAPCVCCSHDGYRLGNGGGFYDRWIERNITATAVICYGTLLVPAVPLEPHDQQTDILITDASPQLTRFGLSQTLEWDSVNTGEFKQV